MTSALNEHQQFERDWWGDCTNTFGEEAKQLTYAPLMGLTNEPDQLTGHWPRYDLHGKSVLDIGGGPVSMLLKTFNAPLHPEPLEPPLFHDAPDYHLAVIDPCPYPEWTLDRYIAAGIRTYRYGAEQYHPHSAEPYDECWIYNVLQHVEDPQQVIATARRHARVLRIFDWVNTPPSIGHPHTLTKDLLDEWIGAPPGAHVDALPDGTVSHVSGNGAVGLAYHGVFSLTPPGV